MGESKAKGEGKGKTKHMERVGSIFEGQEEQAPYCKDCSMIRP